MKSTLADSELTQDAFLGGRLSIWQPKRDYHAGVDPVLLAASVCASASQRVLELGCGVGVASLCLAWRTGVSVVGLEVQQDYAALAARNAAGHDLPFAVVTGDLRDVPAAIRAESFDHVMANPPYYDRTRGTKAPDAGRETALGDGAAMAQWVDVAIRRLKPKGYLTFIQRADRLPELLAAMDGRVGDIQVLPIVPRSGRAAELVVMRARKGAKSAFKLLTPLVLHQGDTHTHDGESYRDDVREILRDGAPLVFR